MYLNTEQFLQYRFQDWEATLGVFTFWLKNYCGHKMENKFTDWTYSLL